MTDPQYPVEPEAKLREFHFLKSAALYTFSKNGRSSSAYEHCLVFGKWALMLTLYIYRTEVVGRGLFGGVRQREKLTFQIGFECGHADDIIADIASTANRRANIR